MFMANHLIGFGAIPPALGGGLTSISLFASNTSTGSTIAVPASILAGDLLLLLDRAGNISTSPTSVTPGDFTNIADTAGGSTTRMISSYKKALGSESGATLTGMNGNLNNNKALYVFRGNVAAGTITPSSPNAQGTTGDPDAQTVLAAAGVAPLVVFGGYGATTAVDTRTFTVAGVGAKDGEINPSTLLYLAYKIYNAAPADVVVDMADEGTNILQSFFVQMAA